jgi:hypothetical protein
MILQLLDPYFVSRGTCFYLVLASELSNPPLQIPFHCDVDLLIVSSYFVLYPSCPLVVGQPLVVVELSYIPSDISSILSLLLPLNQNAEWK